MGKRANNSTRTLANVHGCRFVVHGDGWYNADGLPSLISALGALDVATVRAWHDLLTRHPRLNVAEPHGLETSKDDRLANDIHAFCQEVANANCNPPPDGGHCASFHLEAGG